MASSPYIEPQSMPEPPAGPALDLPSHTSTLSLVHGVSFLSLVAPTAAIYKQTLSFYLDLGFSEVLVYDRSTPPSSELNRSDHCFDSTQESWLYSSGSQADEGERVTLKLRLVPSSDDVSAATDKLLKEERDWRGQSAAFVFYTPYVDNLIQMFRSKKLLYQALPSDSAPIEVYAHDPLGNLLGFTGKSNPFTSARPISLPASSSPDADSSDPAASAPAPADPSSDSTRRKKIGIITSGGDAPGMNSAVRAVVRAAIHKGCDAFAIYEGYEGLVQGGHMMKQMKWEDVRGWLSEGGTLIGTARCAAFRERWGRLKAAKNMIVNGIDALIVCGGDGSLTGADLFRAEWPDLLKELVDTNELTPSQIEGYEHLTIVGLVGSIDNDMSSTDATIGAYSSLSRICQSVDFIDATAYSHSRAFVVEVMGRHCGWLALMAGIATGADYVFIPEQPPSATGWGDEICSVVSAHRKKGKRKTVVIVCEGAIDSDLNPISAVDVKDLLVDRLGLDTRITTLGHVQRGGSAVAFDRLISTLQGYEAVEAVLDSTPETPSPMIGIHENKLVRTPLVDAVALTKQVATAIKARDFNRAMSLRDAEFAEYLLAFKAINHIDDESLKLPEDKRLKIAIINVGAPAGGMNAATRAATCYCLSRGHRAFAIHNGFTGLARHGSVKELNWLDVENWAIRGGSEIGTNRNLPEVDLGMIAYYFQKFEFDGLMIVGGFEAFLSLSQLEQARSLYPALRIPMVCLPATISNNVPGTEYSVGSDTCLNALVDYCDVIKQSASATRRRVFVVEVQGGKSGYVATYAGLCVGALAVYTPERGISLSQLEKDVKFLRESYANDQGQNRAGKLILRNEKSSNVFSTELIADVIREEAKGRFDARTANPGHVQQGGIPSPMDRLRATRLAVKCMEFIESAQARDDRGAPDTATVIGITGASVVYTGIRHLVEHETEVENRRPRRTFWTRMSKISAILSGRPDAEL
ncbi:phosphofructokinase-domain-containing protein [Myxozyma melibiosi]|uniref:ATP-dependent 6-phosphofructokinase n=1 Tax=Myxozyma melibiosi TaxID=54550 RepID=A0ABR1F6A6_9ASCO